MRKNESETIILCCNKTCNKVKNEFKKYFACCHLKFPRTGYIRKSCLSLVITANLNKKNISTDSS